MAGRIFIKFGADMVPQKNIKNSCILNPVLARRNVTDISTHDMEQ
jgi:hypothetical protein